MRPEAHRVEYTSYLVGAPQITLDSYVQVWCTQRWTLIISATFSYIHWIATSKRSLEGVCTSCTNQAQYSLVRMCTPCSKPNPPPNWRSRSRVVVTSCHVLFGSGTGAVHRHTWSTYTYVGIPCTSLCHFTILFCHWSLCDSKLPHKWHLLCCFPHDMHIVPCQHLLNTRKSSAFSHQIGKLPYQQNFIRSSLPQDCYKCPYLKKTNMPMWLLLWVLLFDIRALEAHYPHPLTLPSTFPHANVPVYLWWVTSSASVHSSIVHPHTFVHTDIYVCSQLCIRIWDLHTCI